MSSPSKYGEDAESASSTGSHAPTSGSAATASSRSSTPTWVCIAQTSCCRPTSAYSAIIRSYRRFGYGWPSQVQRGRHRAGRDDGEPGVRRPRPAPPAAASPAAPAARPACRRRRWRPRPGTAAAPARSPGRSAAATATTRSASSAGSPPARVDQVELLLDADRDAGALTGARPSTTSMPGQAGQHRSPGSRSFERRTPRPDDHRVRRRDRRVDQHRPVRRQADRRDPAVLHAGVGDRLVHRHERRLADVQPPAGDAVDVGPGGGEHDAGQLALLARPACRRSPRSWPTPPAAPRTAR